MLLIAARSRDFWLSPGKTLALLFATMCLLDWGLQFVAAVVTNVRLQSELAPGVDDTRAYIFGIWYRSFAVEVGYVASLPILLLVLYKTKSQHAIWRMAWLGFLIFALLIVGNVHFEFQRFISPRLNVWYFEAAIGVPVCLLIVAVVRSVVRRAPMDWWTTLTVIPVVSVWCIGVAIKALG